MKKHIKHRHSPVPPGFEPDLGGIISKMQQQLASLDRKIDMLISRSSPSQRFDQPQRQGEPRQDNAYRPRPMHKAICADCSKECEVPFRPRPERPVYCQACFAKRKSGGPFKERQENRPPEARIVQESLFDKSHAGEKRRGADKKRPRVHKKKR